MEEYQVVFLMWFAKFSVFCVAALFALNLIDRRWRALRAQKSASEARPALAMSRRRSS